MQESTTEESKRGGALIEHEETNLECLTHFLCKFYPDASYVSLCVNNERHRTMPGVPSVRFVSQCAIGAPTSDH
jgi:hypothetical protein